MAKLILGPDYHLPIRPYLLSMNGMGGMAKGVWVSVSYCYYLHVMVWVAGLELGYEL